MKSAALLTLLAVLLFVDVRGKGSSHLLTKVLHGGLYLKFTSTCVLIVTLKDNGGQKCLNPESSFAKNFIKKAIKRR
ncbi:C-X-C motif chemokine 11-6-like [Alosa alosa]|uniref:C-X-C motif chemokine 11-6-like n=1 Tax=Alosa sapidissima TaxID=34773 RepID=UPI001C09BFD7|nr:C-X-C motif chemokine 11-6-like [Alosa sapidissima]XP_048099369.1 C-X-C motif chemokine 11-6-like [Alosa alosa]